TTGLNDLVEIRIQYSGVDADAILTNLGEGTISGDDPTEVENGTIIITVLEGKEWNITITEGTEGVCEIALLGRAQVCPRCVTGDCDFFNIIPVTLNSEGDNWICSDGFYSANGFCGTECLSDLWLVSNALLYDKASFVSFSAEIRENFNGSPLKFFYSTDYDGFHTAQSVQNATWIELRTFDDPDPNAQIDLSNIEGSFYVGVQYVANGLTGQTSIWQILNIAIDADECTNTSTCLLESIALEKGNCDDKGTPTPLDDEFTALITVSFIDAPATGKLSLFGDVSASVDVADLDSETSHTFEVVLPADGRTYTISAIFSDNAICALRNVEAGTAPFGCNVLENCENVLISEYAAQSEGNNNALELYNPTTNVINLATDQYTIAIYANGNDNLASPNVTIPLSGTLNPNATFVLVNQSATNTTLTSVANITANLLFDGNDVIILG
ncbi:MAG: hypothetical protein HC912_11600, partial [Saprospiraceae bacterium]|nr:hypothetical protein [Saprospiraceae bacterium]